MYSSIAHGRQRWQWWASVRCWWIGWWWKRALCILLVQRLRYGEKKRVDGISNIAAVAITNICFFRGVFHAILVISCVLLRCRHLLSAYGVVGICLAVLQHRSHLSSPFLFVRRVIWLSLTWMRMVTSWKQLKFFSESLIYFLFLLSWAYLLFLQFFLNFRFSELNVGNRDTIMHIIWKDTAEVWFIHACGFKCIIFVYRCVFLGCESDRWSIFSCCFCCLNRSYDTVAMISSLVSPWKMKWFGIRFC